MPSNDPGPSPRKTDPGGIPDSPLGDLYRGFLTRDHTLRTWPSVPVVFHWAGVLLVCVTVALGVVTLGNQARRIEQRLDAIARDNAALMDRLDRLVARTDQHREAGAALSPGSPPQRTGSGMRAIPGLADPGYKVYYRVKPGEDTLQISRRFGVSEAALRSWNGLGPADVPQPGQVLVINRTSIRGWSRQEDLAGTGPRVSGWEARRMPGTERDRTPKALKPIDIPAGPAGPQRMATERGKGEAVPGGRAARQVRAKATRGQAVPGCGSSRGRSEGRVHVVRKGENLFAVGKAYGVSWKDIANQNQIPDPDRVRVGQVLRIPTSSRAGKGSAVRGAGTHRVRPGESLYRIGLAYGVDWRAIARANGIEDPSHLRVGQVLEIPGR